VRNRDRANARQWNDGAAAAVLRLVDPDPHSMTWRDAAACLGTDTDAFFPAKGGSTRYAKRICRSCPVRAQCLEEALEWDAIQAGGPAGIWGGKSPQERKAILRERKQAA
jgi:WhiB family redox-sensing transcriptional regulator